MRIDIQEDDGIEVQMAPLIDCVFLLLIFFLVATTLKKIEKEVPLELPDAKLAAREVPRILDIGCGRATLLGWLRHAMAGRSMDYVGTDFDAVAVERCREMVAHFETAFAEYLGVRHAVMVNSGSSESMAFWLVCSKSSASPGFSPALPRSETNSTFSRQSPPAAPSS